MSEASKQSQEKQSIVSRAIEVAAYPLAAITAYFVADVGIKKGAYKGIVGSDLFKAQKAAERKAIRAIPEKVAANPNFDAASEISAIKESYRQEIGKTFKSMNIKTWGDRWKCMTRNEKMTTAGLAAGTATIVLGAALTTASHVDRIDEALLGDKNSPPR
ncbi:MAG: hypothetical protein K2Q01_01435 [Rickettsiales bacterium]|nr:hypothetical protein [Rickettsiales bacterium]